MPTVKACLNGDRGRDLVKAWQGPPDGPDLASVNWHEDGATRIAHLLAVRGVGIEAGLFTPDAARLLAATVPWRVVRILVEALPGISPGDDGIDAARGVLAELPARPDDVDLVVHGEQEWAWPVLRWAQDTGLGIRAGFEDMLTGPRGEQVRGNADLPRLALDTKGTTA